MKLEYEAKSWLLMHYMLSSPDNRSRLRRYQGLAALGLPATAAFMILLATLAVDFPAVILANAIFAHDRQRVLVAYAAIGGFSNVALNLLLIPPFGIAGCAAATLLCQIASNAYLWGRMKKINRFSVLPHLRKEPVDGVANLLLAGHGDDYRRLGGSQA